MSTHWLGPDVIGRSYRDGKLAGVVLKDGTTKAVSLREPKDLPESIESSKDSPRRFAESTTQRNSEMEKKTAVQERTLKSFTLPALETQKAPAAGSKRAMAHDLIARKKGATIEEVMEATGWSRRNAAEGIRLLNKHNGLGLVEGENGRICLE